MKICVQLLVLGSLAFALGCAPEGSSQIQSNQGESILDGTVMEEGHPWIQPSMVMLLDGNLKQLCTGTLVAKNVFLTAAHCLDTSNKEVYVTAAANIQNVSAENTRKVSLREIHPKYNGGGGKYDLALGTFRGEFSDAKKPFPLPKEGTFTIATDLLMTFGFGKDKYGRSGILKFGVLPPKITWPWITDGVIYALQNEGFGICFGDSGGPLFASVNTEERLVGIASFVGSQGGCYSHSGFVQLHPHLSWLKKRIARLQEKTNPPK